MEPGLVKGTFLPVEDDIIRECIANGVEKWSQIAARIQGRSGKQCRERWHNHLEPNLRQTTWDEEEDAILIVAQQKWGMSKFDSWESCGAVTPHLLTCSSPC